MDSQLLLRADYLDIVFDHRNKSYGGYQLRKYYNIRTLKALSFTLFAVTTLCAYSLIPKNHINIVAPTSPHSDTIIFTEPPLITPPPPPPTITPPSANTQAHTVPIIVHNDPDPGQVIQPLEPNVQPGIRTQVGDPVGLEPGTPGGDITTHTVVAPPPPAAPERWVEQMPSFNGDLMVWLSQHINYPDVARENGIEGRVAVEFIVNEDGL